MSKELRNLDPISVALSSGLASILSTFLSNPFEVLKIRLQADQLQCDLHEPLNQQKQFKYIHEVALTSQAKTKKIPLMNNQYRSFLGILTQMGFLDYRFQTNNNNPFIKIYQTCSCISSNSLYKAFQHIYHHEGALTFLNGWRYAVLQAGISNICYFSAYEKSKKYFSEQNIPQQRFLVPWLASGFSRALTSTITFPLEYWKVLQSSSIGYQKNKNIQLGTQFHSAYLITIQRDVVFSCIYWPLLENIKMELQKYITIQKDIVNLLSGILAGSITAFITLPLDVVKTRKQVSTRVDLLDHKIPRSTWFILEQIYYSEGLQGLFKGYQPRIVKVTLHSGLVYMMYEYFKENLFVSRVAQNCE